MHRRYDKNHVPIELLRTLVVIAKERNFTKAGNVLDLSQPAISAQVRRLEQLVGGNVFEKTGGGLTMTPRGKTIERYANRILELNDQIFSLSGAQTTKRFVRIGVMSSFANKMMVKIFRSCVKTQKDVQVQLQCDASHNLITTMDDGHLDIAVVIFMSNHNVDLIGEWDEQMVWAGAPDLIVSPNAPIPFISWPNSPADRIAIDAFEAAGRRYAVSFAGRDYNSRYVAAQAGLGYMVMPERAVFGGVKIAQESFLPKLPKLRAGICLRPGFEQSEYKELVDAIVSVVGSVVPLRTATDKSSARRQGLPRRKILSEALIGTSMAAYATMDLDGLSRLIA